jgi:hypothetical protein
VEIVLLIADYLDCLPSEDLLTFVLHKVSFSPDKSRDYLLFNVGYPQEVGSHYYFYSQD